VLVSQEQAGWRPVDGLPVGTLVVAEGRNLVADGTRLQITKPATDQGK
jgi:hypothetical protein